MKKDNLTTENVQSNNSNNKENKLEEVFDDIYCDLCEWLDDENVNWKEKVERILEECKKVEGLKLISNESIFTPIKNIFDVKSLFDKCDYNDYEKDTIMNSFCVQRLRFDTIYSGYKDFSSVIYILEDGHFFIHHNYYDKEVLENSIGWDFSSDYITNKYSGMLYFLLYSKNTLDEITSGNDAIRKFAHNDDMQSQYENCVIVNNNEIYFGYPIGIELKFKEIPSIDSLIRVADAIYKMKARYESENNQK